MLSQMNFTKVTRDIINTRTNVALVSFTLVRHWYILQGADVWVENQCQITHRRWRKTTVSKHYGHS